MIDKSKDTSVIPKGFYCYDGKYKCPYWDVREDKPDQENGYCHYLEKGDWNVNKEKRYNVRKSDGTWGELESAEEIGFPMSILWDQCKECDINYGIDNEEELIEY